jgi:hypothetical protein
MAAFTVLNDRFNWPLVFKLLKRDGLQGGQYGWAGRPTLA